MESPLDNIEPLIREQVPLARKTTVQVGGAAAWYSEVQTVREVAAALRWARDHQRKVFLLGAGSNVLVPDAGVDGLVLKLGSGFRYLKDLGEGRFEVGGAMALMSLARRTARLGYTGLEFAGGIPASLGGAVRMNAGAHGSEMSAVVREVAVVLPDHSVDDPLWLPSSELSFAYRRSVLPEGAVIVGARLHLQSASPEATAAALAHHLEYRKSTQPLQLPSFGSVFKNPVDSAGGSAGALIETVGLRGASSGDMQIASMHANWIVNPEKRGSCEDVRLLMTKAAAAVFEEHGITLEPEVCFWGEGSVLFDSLDTDVPESLGELEFNLSSQH